MPMVNGRTGRVVAAMLMLTPAALAQNAGRETGLGGGGGTGGTGVVEVTTPLSVEAQIAEAEALARSGSVVRAKKILSGLVVRNELEAVSQKDKQRALSNLRSIENRIKFADQVEMSLQKADLALEEGDLLMADHHSAAVLKKGAIDEGQRERARAIAEVVSSQRGGRSEVVASAFDRMESDYLAGRFGAVKSTVQSLRRSGATLSLSQQETLDRYTMRIVDLERAQGRPFGPADASMGMVQPGIVDRGNEQPAGEMPAQPAADPSAPQPIPDAMPSAPQPEPMSQPVFSQPSTPTQDDVIKAALRVDALRVMAEADQALAQSRNNLAVEKYNLLLSAYRVHLQPTEIAQAESQLAVARTRMNEGNIGTQTAGQIDLLRQRAIAEFDHAMSEADRALAQGDTRKATLQSATARLAVNNSRGAFNESEYNGYISRVEDLNRRITQSEDAIRQKEAESRTKKLAEEAAKAEGVRASEKSRKITESIDRARALQMEQKYREALEIVEQVLFLDPRNQSALLLQDALSNIVVYEEFYETQRLAQRRAARQTLDNERAKIGPNDLVDYPTDWPSKSFLRGEQSAFFDTPEDRATLSRLQTTRLPVDFKDNTVAQAVEYLAKIANVNYDIDWESLSGLGVTEDSTVNLKLNNVSAEVALNRLIQKLSRDSLSKAGWAVTDGALIVASDEALRKDAALAIYDITDLLFDVPNFDEVPQIDLQNLLQQAQNGGGGGGGQSPFRDDQQDEEGRDPDRPTRQERIDLIRTIITSNVDTEGWSDVGGTPGKIQEINGNLIITQTPKAHREISGLLSKLRETRSLQINVEAKFLLVNQNWFEQIGFDVDLVINANNNQVRTARGINNAVQPSDFFDFSGGAASPNGLQRIITGATDLNGDGDSTDPGEVAGDQNIINPRGWSPIGGQQNSIGLSEGLAVGDFANSVLSASPALGIAGQFLDDIQVDFLIKATQADQRTVQLTAPRLTFTNGQTSNIFVVTQQAFVSDLMPMVGDSAVGFDPTVAVASEGVTLLVEGVVSSDRRYVTMNIDAGIGRIDGFAQQPVTAVAGGQLVNSADTQSFIQLPTITVTRVRTTVTVPDEGTILLGGQRLITELEVETGVPVLSKIPILNRFFTNRIESKEEQTLLILAKPTVLIQAEQEEKNFPGILDSLQSGFR